ncbi:MAG: glycogen synthase GlgA [Thermodesulfovibrionales bacterium]|nr:glycogen synthase GlgA [Nitrospinota bacterium]MCG2708841.1 glycogen synthase GlgA [Thermodesulfovibrionales bacterium]
MKILIATPEAVPFAKTGGLADVTGALLNEYRKMKEEAYLVMPLYGRVRENFKLKDTGLKISVPLGNTKVKGRIFSYENSAQERVATTYFIECDEFFDREEIYGTPRGDYPDNAARFIFFSRGVLEACRALGFKPDIIHCNDWQTGLIPLYLKTIYSSDKFFDRTASIITIHNLGYQGLFPQSDMPLTGFDKNLFTPEGIEFYGKINFLKAGLISADSITTVSNNYAKEILSREYGSGLDGVLRKRVSALTGIVNGIDSREWNPESDAFIKRNYSLKGIDGKKECKLQLLKECSIRSDAEMPLIGMVGRLSGQKGLDLILESLDEILSAGANLIILGRGDEMFHRRLSSAAEKYKGRMYVKIGFEDSLAHKIYAGTDIFLMPSRYEPCGIGQLIAMRYGTIPVARRTGGLADTVLDHRPLEGEGTGFLFSDYTADALQGCLKRALCVYVNKARWKKLIRSAMKMNFSWPDSAKRYIELYDKVTRMKMKRE